MWEDAVGASPEEVEVRSSDEAIGQSRPKDGSWRIEHERGTIRDRRSSQICSSIER